jgi:hypothetical protein
MRGTVGSMGLLMGALTFGASAHAQPLGASTSDTIPGLDFGARIVDGIDFDFFGAFDLPADYGLGMRATWWSFLDGGRGGRGSLGGLHVDNILSRGDELLAFDGWSGLRDVVREGLYSLDVDLHDALAVAAQGAQLLWWVASNWAQDDDLKLLTAPLIPMLAISAEQMSVPRRVVENAGQPRLMGRRRSPVVPTRMLQQLDLVLDR